MNLLEARALRAWQTGNKHRWVTCLAASRIVGQYEPGETENFSKALGLSLSQTQNLAKAGLGFRAWRKYGLDWQVLKRITPSHVSAAAELAIRHDLLPRDIVADLMICAENGYSVMALRAMIAKQNGDDKDLAYYITRILALLRKALKVADEATRAKLSKIAQGLDDLP